IPDQIQRKRWLSSCRGHWQLAWGRYCPRDGAGPHWTGGNPHGYRPFRDSNLANCAPDSRQSTNADQHSALWILVVRRRQLDRRGGRVALVVTPRAQRQCVSVSETDAASADSRLRGLRDRNVRRAYPDTLAIFCNG